MEVRSFFGIDNWKKFRTMKLSNKDIHSTIIQEIKTQNDKGYIVTASTATSNQEQSSNGITLYKKHATSIFKSIIIGSLSLIDFSDLQKTIDKYTTQSDIIKKQFDNPEFTKFQLQKKMYFPDV